MHYISITGFAPHSFWRLPGFFWHAGASMRQAQAADGNLMAGARRINGIFHTVSLWRSRDAMLDYLTSGAHRKAMAAFPSIGSGYGFGFEGDEVPDWADVHRLWQDEGSRRQKNRQAAA